MEGSPLDTLFQAAVSAIDRGDTPALEILLREHPVLVRERLTRPGPWLREAVGDALDGFFKDPYLLWFVAEDPVRNGALPANIADCGRAIVRAARDQHVQSLQEQLEYALRLVAWSWIAREHGVQNELIDVLMDAGARPGETITHDALINRNVEAAEHLLARGAPPSLATLLCLGRWDEADRLAGTASVRDRQVALVLAALNGKAEALRRLLELGVDINAYSTDIYEHATALHHAVCSGNLEAVTVLVDAGADLTIEDRAWHGTPLGWAEHYVEKSQGGSDVRQYPEIAAFLRDRLAVSTSQA